MARRPPKSLIDDLLRQGRLATQPPKKRRGRLPTSAVKQKAVVRRNAPKMARAVKRAVDETKRKTPVAKIAEALETRDVEAAVAAVPWEDVGARILLEQHGIAYAETFSAVALIEAERVGSAYSVLNSSALDAMRSAGAKFVTNISDNVRAELREILVDTMNRGLSTRETAKALRDRIGLTPRASRAIDKYRVELEEAGKTAEQVERLVARRESKALNHRAEVIARTEAQAAANAGQQASWAQAREQGVLDETFKQEWLLSDIACPVCSGAGGQQRKLNELFELGDGTLIAAPPAHPNCLCSLVAVFDEAKKAEAA